MIDFTGELGKYRLIKTEDGSTTIWSEFFNENCHSLAGAKEETLYNYIEGCKILKKSEKEILNILEIGHGPGVGVLETFKYLDQINPKGKIHFVSTEIDSALVEWTIKNTNNHFSNFPNYIELKKIETPKLTYYEAKRAKKTLTILLGDAEQTLKRFDEIFNIKFNAVYQDAFSPKNNSTLWSIKWFELLKSICSNDTILSTYSSATNVREALIESGWCVHNRKGFQNKRTSTIATLVGKSDNSVLEKIKKRGHICLK